MKKKAPKSACLPLVGWWCPSKWPRAKKRRETKKKVQLQVAWHVNFSLWLGECGIRLWLPYGCTTFIYHDTDISSHSVGLRLTHLQFVALPGHNSTRFLGSSIHPSDGQPTSVCPTDPVVICCLVLWLYCQRERRRLYCTWADRPQATNQTSNVAQKWPIKCQENYYNSPMPHCLSNLTVCK